MSAGARLPFDLMLVTDPNVAGGVVPAVARALVGVAPGRVAVQLRAKGAPAGALYDTARALRALTSAAGACLLVNDRADVARAVAADGVHLPEAGASYAVVAPFGDVPFKGPPLGLAGVAAAVAAAPGLPVLALGGVGPDDVAPLLAAGASGVAVVRAVFSDAAPEGTVRALLSSLDAAWAALGRAPPDG